MINWYINVPIPAPNRQELIGVPQILAISTVAVIILKTCCKEKLIHSYQVFGISLISYFKFIFIYSLIKNFSLQISSYVKVFKALYGIRIKGILCSIAY